MNDDGLIKIACLGVVTYVTYIVAHVAAGSLIPDGLILSGIVGFLAAVAGFRFGGFAEKQKIIEERGYTTEIQSDELASEPTNIR